MGDDATREIVRLFLDDFPVSMGHLSGGTPQEQHRVAHGLKSSARHMGAIGLSERMAAIENRLESPGERVSASEISAAVADFAAVAPGLRLYAGEA